MGARVRGTAQITTPRANSHYLIDPMLPRSQQMIELTSTIEPGAQWFVNGERQTPQSDGRVFWRLAPGEWTVRAVTGTVSVEERISVE
jgi:hypothetical protein